MSDRSAIEWTDTTWNPVRGCTKVSPGCAHCYAETFAERWRGIPGHPYEQGFDLRLVPEKLTEPFRWKSPRRVFVNSMSDLFHEDVPDSFIEEVLAVCALSPRHQYQILTKRADRMRTFFESELRWAMIEGAAQALYANRNPGEDPSLWLAVHDLPNVWLGVSVENRRHGLPRIEDLRATPAAVRFLSVEPLLEDLGELDLAGIGWVIVGGESGPKARPMDPAWVRSIRDQCVAQGVSLFVKQMGGHPNKRSAIDEMPEDLRIREFPTTMEGTP